MNNTKRKCNIYSNSCPKMNWAVHGNDRWRLLLRLRKTRRLYLVSVTEEGVPCNFYEYALNEDAIRHEYNYLSIVKIKEVKK